MEQLPIGRFEYDMALIDDSCVRGIKKIEIKDTSWDGDRSSWKCEWLKVIVHDVKKCDVSEFNVRCLLAVVKYYLIILRDRSGFMELGVLIQSSET